MRVKFIDSSGNTMDNTVVIEIDTFFLLDDSNKLFLNSPDFTFESARPLSSAEKIDYERWTHSLLVSGYADLTVGSLTFVNTTGGA